MQGQYQCIYDGYVVEGLVLFCYFVDQCVQWNFEY